MSSSDKVTRLPQRKAAAGKLGGPVCEPAGELRFALLRDQFPAVPVKSPNHAFVATDLLGRITSWNGAAENLFGWSADETVGGDLAELLIAERYRETFRAGLRRYVHTRSSQMIGKPVELVAQNRQGREIQVEISIWPATVNGEVTFQAFLRNISEQAADAREERRETALGSLLQKITADANKATSPEVAVQS